MECDLMRTADERVMRRLVRRGARIMAEYNWAGSGVAELEARGREWVLQLPRRETMERAA